MAGITLELMDVEEANGVRRLVVTKSIGALPHGATVFLGRHLSVETSVSHTVDTSGWDIRDPQLSRKQLKLVLHSGSEVAIATVLSGKASFLQTDGSLCAIRKGEARAVPPNSIIWLWGSEAQALWRHPVRMRETQPLLTCPHPLSAAQGPPAEAAPSASLSVGEWQVRLQGTFKPYTDANVQRALEQALHVRGEPSTNVRLRGVEYVVRRATDGNRFEQVQAADMTRTREVRRVPAAARSGGGIQPGPPAAAHAIAHGKRRAPACDHGDEEEAEQAPGGLPTKRAKEGAPSARAEPLPALTDPSAAPAQRTVQKKPARAGPSQEPGSTPAVPAVTVAEPPAEDTVARARVAALRRRGEAIAANIFDGEADVDAELAFLLQQTPADCLEALSGVQAALAAAPAASTTAIRLQYIAHLCTELAAGGTPWSWGAGSDRAVAMHAAAGGSSSEPPCPGSGSGATSSEVHPSCAAVTAARWPPPPPPPAARPKRVAEVAATRADHTEVVEMLLMDMHEAADGASGAIDLFGVDEHGRSTHIRASGFRNFFYVQCAGPPPAPCATLADRGMAAGCAARASTNGGAPSAFAATALVLGGACGAQAVGSCQVGELLACVLDALLPHRLLLHVACAVCHGWRRVAAALLCGRVTQSVLAELSGATAADLRLDLVQRTPLLAYYGETLARSRRELTPSPGPLSGEDRSVPMLRVEYAGRLKPKDLLAAFRRAAVSAPMRGTFALMADGDVVSAETGLAPAGTSALLRRFAVEKCLSGGGWLVAAAAPVSTDATRCARAYACAHDAIEGKAPDILTPSTTDQERWASVPALSILSVRVASSNGFTEPQWEARESTSGSCDGVRMIACEHCKGRDEHVAATVLAFEPGAVAARSVTSLQPARGDTLPEQIALHTFNEEGAMLAAFEQLVHATDPDVLLTYDARALGMVTERYSELCSGAPLQGGKAKSKSAGAAMQLGRDLGTPTRVSSVVTYSKAWASRAGARQQTSENLETHEVMGVAGRFSLDLLRALVCHQTHKLTTYSFHQAVQAVLNEESEQVLPEVLKGAPTARVALHCAAQARLVHRLARKLAALEETIEMARVTGLPLRTVANQVRSHRPNHGPRHASMETCGPITEAVRCSVSRCAGADGAHRKSALEGCSQLALRATPGSGRDACPSFPTLGVERDAFRRAGLLTLAMELGGARR